MLEPVRRLCHRLAVFALVLTVAPLAAVTAPPAAGKATANGMLDARVNAKGSFQSATAARQSRVAAGRVEARQQAASIAAAAAALRKSMPGLEVQASGMTGGPRSVRNLRGALTAAAPGSSSEAIVRGFLAEHGDLYGLSAADLADLVVLGDSPGGSSGLRMLRLEQQIDGRPVFQSETRFTLARDGRLMKSVGLLVPGARTFAPAIDASKLLAPADAVVRLLAASGKSGSPASFEVSADRGGRLELAETDAFVAGPVTARQVLFPLAPGLLVPAWSLVVFTSGDEDWYALVDAETGDVLWRKNIRDYVSAHDARFRVYVQADGTTPADSPAPASPNTVTAGSGTQFPEIAPTIVSMHTAMSATASPNGWIDDCPGGVCATTDTNTSQEQTVGNNVRACMDRNGGADANVCDTAASGVLDAFGKPTGNADTNGRNRDFLGTAPRDFQTNFLPPPQAGNPEAGQDATGAGASGTNAFDQYRRGAVTHLFYVANWYHDKLFALGFDEPSANFQLANFQGLGGAAGDRVNADAQDGSGTNNANFSTPPDGTSGRAQMFRFTGPTIDRDGDLDSEILIHELTHGTSNRLVGNAVGLNWDTARGLGEGWSDYLAMSLLNNTNADTPSGHYGSGAYATYKLGGLLDNYLYGIRRFPYTTDNTVNPMTWADVDDVTLDTSGGIAVSPLGFDLNGGNEVHNSGEIWALTLWEVRDRVIADPAGANGSVPTGNQTMLQLVIDALKMTPIDPSFLDARDAILDADCATNACANEDSIWGGFTDRGLGYRAVEPYHIMGRYVRSHLGIGESFQAPFLDVVNPATDVAIDDSASNNNGAIDPGEAVRLTVTLTNPWRRASRAVASATATLTTSTPGVNIFDNASAYGPIAPQGTAAGDTFLVTVDTTVLCGSAIDFTLTTTSSLGTTATTFQLRVGAASGTDPVVTYTGDPSPDLPIVDNRPRGTLHQITITDDFVIADLNFRIDSVTHTFPGDVTAMLRSPGGVGTDFVSLIGGLVAGGGDGDNLTNMLIDDDLVASAATDMTQAPNAAAPYTGSWLPVYNGPWAALVDPLRPADPVPQLSHFDGLSTKGTWSALVADNFNLDAGTLNAWSMIVTPVHFACTAFAPAAVIAPTKTVTGTFAVGGTVTYTVVLNNSGTDAQGDNPGNEFVDTLPASLTLVSAVATSGTATANVLPNQVTWNGSLAPLGGSVTITITATINAGAQGTTISNQGTASFDANNDNVNEATALTDDPAVGGAADPTTFLVASAALSATKTVAGTLSTGGTATYTIVISNAGSSASPDNAGDELTDVLPAQLTLVSAIATSGTAVATIATNTVTWNGSVPASGSVTITITATINAGFALVTVSNQGSVAFDADLNGSNEATVLTDDPAVGGAADPTQFVIQPASVTEIPTLSELGLFALGLGLWLAAWSVLRRRRRSV